MSDCLGEQEREDKEVGIKEEEGGRRWGKGKGVRGVSERETTSNGKGRNRHGKKDGKRQGEGGGEGRRGKKAGRGRWGGGVEVEEGIQREGGGWEKERVGGVRVGREQFNSGIRRGRKKWGEWSGVRASL